MAGKAGRSGRIPKPTPLKVIQGTFRKDRANPNEPIVDPGIPEEPKKLKAKVKKYWLELVETTNKIKVLTPADKQALRLLAETFVDYDDAMNAPEKSYTKIIQLRNQIMIGLREFGLTPSSRSRVSVKPKPTKNEYSDL